MSKYPFMQVVSAFLLTLAPGISGCGDEDNSTGGNGGTQDDSVFAVLANVFSPGFTSQISYVGFTPTLDAGEIQLSDMIEVASGGTLFGIDGSGEFYIVSQEELTVTKYTLDDAGLPEQIGRLGLLSQGINSLGANGALAFDGPDRGFLVAVPAGVILELDLEAMTIVRRIDVSELIQPDLPTFIAAPGFPRSGNRLVFATYAFDLTTEVFSPQSKIAFLDPDSGEVEAVDAPCGGLSLSTTSDGDIYFVTGPYLASVNVLDDSRAPIPCMVRLPAGSTTPEAVFASLNDLTGGRPSGGAIPIGDERVLVRAADTDAFPIMDNATAQGLFALPVWETWQVDLRGQDAPERLDREYRTGSMQFFRLGDQAYEAATATDFSSTTLVRVTGSDAPLNALVTPGVPFQIVRVR